MQLRLLRKNWLLGIVLPVLLASCQVMLIGAYDQVTDQSIQKIQNDVSTVLVKIEGNIDNNTPADNNFQNFKNSYDVIDGEVESLKIRCSSLPKYQKVSDQVGLLGENIKKLEAFHKSGTIDKQQAQVLKTTFEVTFKAMIVLQNGLKREKTDKAQ